MRLNHREAQVGIRCAYCHGEGDGAMHACPGCRTQLHVGCHRELGGCSSLGCPHEQPRALSGVAGQRASSLVRASAAAVLAGWSLAALQELFLLHHTQTPSDVTALALHSVLVTTALGIWLARRPNRALPLVIYVAVGLALSSYALQRGVWLVAGCALAVTLVPRSVRARS